jgi:hypothetical protein
MGFRDLFSWVSQSAIPNRGLIAVTQTQFHNLI